MKLNKWIKLVRTSNRQLAKKLDVSSTTVSRWVKSKRFPKVGELILIEQITEGAVTANDFVNQWQNNNISEVN